MGLPWKKEKVAMELKQYVEEKYDIEVELEESYYNFKDKSYGATFVLKNEQSISFSAEKNRSGELDDYYPEAVWVNEVKNDVTPILKQSFPSFSIEDFLVNSVYGMGDELVKGKEIPSYKDVYTGTSINAYFRDNWTNETEQKLLKESYAFISSLKEKGVRNIDLNLYLKEKNDGDVNFVISIKGQDFNKIESEEDLKKFRETF